MKKYLILPLLIIISELIFAQDYQISFTGSGQNQTIDSAKVFNLSQKTSITLFGEDVLHLVKATGISEEHLNENNILVYPNPMISSSRIELKCPKNGSITIFVTDLLGRRLLTKEQFLERGNHAFKISGLKAGTYLIHSSNSDCILSKKLISTDNTTCAPLLKYEGNSMGYQFDSLLKNSFGHREMQYNEGERLLIEGFSSRFARILTIIPSESQAVNFEFIECKDANNNNYSVVSIGSQTWMAENLKATKYNNEDTIPIIIDDGQWLMLNSGAFCWHNNDEHANKDIYGALYNWYSVVDNRKICPPGWHIPSDSQWEELSNYLGTTSEAGGKLKEVGYEHWFSPNYGASNESGFTGLPGGSRGDTGSFYLLGNFGYWWSSTEQNEDCAFNYFATSMSSYLSRGEYYGKRYGFSVRCLKD